MRDIYVKVRLADARGTLVWRTVRADDISEAIELARLRDDVETVIEASIVPGGVVT